MQAPFYVFPFFSRHFLVLLELCVLGSAGEGDDIADVLHTGYEEYQTLETEAEACMGTTSVLAGIKIPPQVGHVHLTALYLGHQLVIAFLADRTADNLTNGGEENIGALHGRTGCYGALVTYGTAFGRCGVLLHIE